MKKQHTNQSNVFHRINHIVLIRACDHLFNTHIYVYKKKSKNLDSHIFLSIKIDKKLIIRFVCFLGSIRLVVFAISLHSL